MTWGTAYGDPFTPDRRPVRSAGSVRARRSGAAAPGQVERMLRALCVLPCAGTQRLARVCGLEEATAARVLESLQDNGHVEALGEGRSRRWRKAGTVGTGGFGLPAGALRLLDAVERHPGASGGRLAEVSGLSVPDVSRFGTCLEEAGHIARLHVGRYVHYVPAGSGS